MNKKLVFALVFGIIFLLILIGLQLVRQYNPTQITPSGKTPPLTTTGGYTRQPQTIATYSGATYSAVPILQNRQTSVVTTDLYKNTNNADMYNIFYNDSIGIGMILLYNENLKQARSAAETQLLTVLPYAREQICDMDIRVLTNEYVSKAYSGINLGLSLCPGSVQLP